MKDARSLQAVDAFTASVGRAPALWSIWSSWGGTDRAFPDTTFLTGLRQRHVVPVIICRPANPANPDGDSSYTYRHISAGVDGYIRHWARAAKAYGGRVVVRFAHEMDGYWSPWGVTRFDNTPHKFVLAWRHLWNIIRGATTGGVRATNLKFLWSPNSPGRRCASYASVCPGDKYVNYAGFSAFNGSPPNAWKPMVDTFATSMEAMAAVTTKPIIAAETGSSKHGGDKSAWIRDGYPAVYTQFPALAAIMYFNLGMRFVAQLDWRLTSPLAARTAYQAIVAQPRFQGNLPQGPLAPRTIIVLEGGGRRAGPDLVAGGRMRPNHLRTLGASLLAIALLWNPAVASTSPDATATMRKIAMGVSMLPYEDLSVLDTFTASVGGHSPAIWSMWSDWRGSNSSFPDTAFLDQLLARQTVPMVFWQPVDETDSTSPDFTYNRIVAGDWDAYIRAWARDAKAWGHRIIVRFAHEMDGDWFPWGIGNFDNTPQNYVAAWRHVWNIFKGPGGVGATNVRFLWSPLGMCACQAPFYPGDRYVGYVGFTYFNWAGTHTRWGMLDAYRRRVAWLTQVTKKPVIVAETGSNPVGGSKAAWIKYGFPAVYKNLPSITAIVYFNLDMRALARQPDWRLESPPAALAAYAALLAKPRYQGRIK